LREHPKKHIHPLEANPVNPVKKEKQSNAFSAIPLFRHSVIPSFRHSVIPSFLLTFSLTPPQPSGNLSLYYVVKLTLLLAANAVGGGGC